MTRAAVKEALTVQLTLQGGAFDHYLDLVNDYMSLWDAKRKLIADIKKRGVTYEDYSSVGVKMMKNNQSVKDLVMVNRQMLSILKELGLTTANTAGNSKDDDLASD